MTRKTIIRVLIPLGVLVASVLSFAIFEPIQVLPRIRLAPGFVLTDQAGRLVTSEDLRGKLVLYNFTYAACPEPCAGMDETIREVAGRIGEADLAGTELRFVTVSFDPANDTVPALAARAEQVGADGDLWRWAVPDASAVRNVVSGGFRTYFEPLPGGGFEFDPAFVLVDGWGVVRGEYRYRTLAGDADRIVRHIGILGEEIRNSRGAASLAYEAAHFFLCYP